MIGDMSTINEINDPWISTDPLVCCPYTINYEALEDKVIGDLMVAGEGMWDRSFIEQCLEGQLSSHMLSMAIPWGDSVDRIGCEGTSGQRVRVSEPYTLIRGAPERWRDGKVGVHPLYIHLLKSELVNYIHLLGVKSGCSSKRLFLWNLGWDRLPC